MSSSGASSGGAGLLAPAAGQFYSTHTGSVVGPAPASGQMNLGAFYLPYGITFTQLGLHVVVAASAGGTGTPVIYVDDGTGQPGALAASVAALDATVLGVQLAQTLVGRIPAPVTLPPGWYWGGVLTLGTPATLPGYRGSTPGQRSPLGGIARGNNVDGAAVAFSRTGLAAAPDPAGAVATNVNVPDLIIGT